GADADGVLGQAGFMTSAFGTTSTTMFGPSRMATDPAGRLYVADNGIGRILIFNNAVSKSDGAAADHVLGQPNFTSADLATTQNGLVGPNGIGVDGATGRLYVADGVGRVLVHQASSGLPVELDFFQLD